MALLDRLQRDLPVSGTANPAEWLLDLFGTSGDTHSGKAVTPTNSLALVPVFSAVQLVAGAVAGFPLMTYKRLDAGRERATNHRAYPMLHSKPNDRMAADEFWEIVTAHLLLWGNHLSAKERDASGRVSKLWPLPPGRVGIGLAKDGKTMVYEFDGKLYGPDEVLHIRGLSLDGVRGLSPIQQARNALANSMSREEFVGRFWKNGAHHAGVLQHPQELSDKAQKRLQRGWASLHSGLAHAGKTLILEEGMEWQAMGMPLADAQFIEQEKHGRTEVALLFRIPPHMLAADSGGSSLTYETSEGNSLDFVKWTARRWTRRIEGSLARDLDIFPQGDRFYAEFLMDAILRADSAGRSAYYTAALNPTTGWMEPEEVRDLENLPALTDEQKQARKDRQAAAKPAPTVVQNQGGSDDKTTTTEGDE